MAEVAARWTALAAMARPSEAETESEFIYPILDRLEWERLPQPMLSKSRRDVSDELLFLTPAAKVAARALADNAARFRHGVVVVENEARDTLLDRAKGQAETPSNQILRYLKRSDGIPGTTVRWGLLTNGRFWRLYFTGARQRDEDFVELELPALLGPLRPPVPEGADDWHWARVFLLLFGRDSYAADPQGRTFFDESRVEGRRFEERITDSLSEAVFDRVFPELVEALARSDPRRAPADASWRAEVKEAALILLFRFLFILYAEDRGLLPVGNAGYREHSFQHLRADAEKVADGRLAVRAGGGIWWARIRDLFDAIKHGSTELGLPEYNGGLFDDATHPLLGRVVLPDTLLARMLDDLSRAEVEGRRRFINYRDLTVQQLGAIYERLLERDVVADGAKVGVAANAVARHRAGSFFTTDKLVQLILGRAVGPLLEQARTRFRAKLAALERDRRPVAEKLADLRRDDPAMAFVGLRICDPAMGSGHFLVSLVDHLAVETLAAMAEASGAVTWAEYRSPLAERIGAIRAHIRQEFARHGWEVREEHLDDRALLRRIILKRCVYGVDSNPLAVELAKLALWLHCFTVGAPLSFLDHHLRTGDSLLGERVGEVLREHGLLAAPSSVRSALNASSFMARVEELTDADIGEVKESVSAFAEAETMTAELRRFLDFYHAGRWAAPGLEMFGARAFLDGKYGDPVRIIAGDEAPRDSGESVARIGKQPVDAAATFAAFQKWFARVPALAAERRLLHWQPAFPGVWTEWEGFDPRGGFDAVVGNPPYVRQEHIKAVKPALEGLYATYGGVADLYVYFIEQGLRLLRKGGYLSFVVTNKWLKAGYAEKLRGMLAREAWVEQVIDFGHAKGFFPDADVMPCVFVARRPNFAEEAPRETAIAVIPRDAVDMTRLEAQVRAATFSVPRTRLDKAGWLLESPEVAALMDKIRRAGLPLKEYAGVSPMYGIKTGLNEAFVIDGATRERLIAADARSEEIIKPYLRGQDIDRWASAWAGQWMIVLASSANRRWPWSGETDLTRAEPVFAETYPAIHAHMMTHRVKLVARQDQGRFFWELRECAYYRHFQRPKILYQVIQYHPQFSLDRSESLSNDKTFFLPSDDAWLLTTLNSPLLWWFNWRHLVHLKDEALNALGYLMEVVPIAGVRKHGEVEAAANALHAIRTATHETARTLADWYRHDLDIPTIPTALREPFGLDADRFIAAIRKARGKAMLGTAAIQHIRAEHARLVAPLARRLAEAERLERLLSDLVNEAYGLPAEDVALMWRTAPPRMPIAETPTSPHHRWEEVAPSA